MNEMLRGQSKSAFTIMLERVLPEYLKDSVKTCVPGYVLSFDATNQLANVQIGLKMQRSDTGEYVDPSPVMQVPVQFPGGKAGTIEYRIDPGTEGMIFFSQEAADSWIVQGGIAVRSDNRRFSPDDAFFAPGFRSIAGALPDFKNNGIRIRNQAGTSYLWVKDDGSVEVDGTLFNVKCPMTAQSDVTTLAGITNQGVTIGKNHRHTGVQTGSGTSGVVTP